VRPTPNLLHRYANPGQFLRLARALQPWLSTGAIIFLTVGIVWGLFFAPADWQQGETVRIMYVHVPMAWLASSCYLGLAVCGLLSLVWRHPLADLAAIEIGPVGACAAALCLITGSLWGQPMWGTWWVWDARLTSVLVLFFLYLGHIALINCASPGYLHEHGVPARPEDLLQGHLSVGYASPSTGRELPWDYVVSGQERLVAVPSRVIANNAESYIACCVAGMGLIQIPRVDVQHLLDRGELVEVMPGFRAAPMQVSLVYPNRRQRSRRLNTFIEWFEALVRPHLDP